VKAESVTAWFSGVTNSVERMLAEKDVVVMREGRVARGEQAVYHDSTGVLELTGQPTASMPEGQITQAAKLEFDRLNARLIGRGKFKSEWKRPAANKSAAVPATAPLAP
jgi:hypothetical protein